MFTRRPLSYLTGQNWASQAPPVQGAWKFIVREEKKKGAGKTGVLLPNMAAIRSVAQQCSFILFLEGRPVGPRMGTEG